MIRYTDSTASISVDQLSGFFVGWADPPSPKEHLTLLQNSDYVVLAIDDETEVVIGFVTAVSDRILAAYIPLLEVLPAYQGQGVGTELMRRMLTKLNRYYMVDLICDPELQPFYERLGMEPYTGMIRRHRRRETRAEKDDLSPDEV
jgi:GNAT superfamily N-acetyltransferase